MPITLVLLVFVFGSIVAASLPLLVGAVAVVGTFLALFAIDYSLFVASRYREELRAGHDVEAAVVRTVERAGRTAAFSALTVAVSLAALLVFPLYFLRSFAYARVAVVLIAMVASIVSLPALLATLGHRVDAGRLFSRHAPEAGTGFWHGVAPASCTARSPSPPR